MAATNGNDFISVDRVRAIQKYTQKPCLCSEPEISNYDKKFDTQLTDTYSKKNQHTGIIGIRKQDLDLQRKDDAPNPILIIAEINPFQSKNELPLTVDTTLMNPEKQVELNLKQYFTVLTAKQHKYRGQYEMDNSMEILSTEIIKVQSPARETRKLKNMIRSFSRSLVRGFRALLCCSSKPTTEEQ